MLIILPVMSFLLLWEMIYQRDTSYRSSFLKASLIIGLCVQIITELLSAFHLFTATALGVFWFAIFILALTTFIKNNSLQHFKFPQVLKWDLIDASLLFSIGMIIFITGLIAWIAPPNNWDSMTYHMSRVAHWAQNKTVAFYPTAIPRQLWASPWAEYAIAQLYVLAQSDRWSNCVQWLSMIGSIVSCSAIANKIGANVRGQIAAAALCASLPMGILEASSTQNDYAVTFWTLCSLYFGINWRNDRHTSSWIWLTLATGLALATKNTALVFLLPFFLWFVSTKPSENLKNNLISIIAVFLIAIAINIPQYVRNYRLSANPISLSSESKTVANEILSLAGTFSTALRYLGLNLCTSNESANQSIQKLIENIHHVLGLNIVDPRFTMGEEYKIKQDIHEDNSCNTAHTLLFLFSMAAITLLAQQKLSTELKIYFLCLLTGFFIFCLTIKWQPWGNRLLLPPFILAIPCVATALNKCFSRWLIGAAFACALLSIPWLTENRSRPLTGKDFTIFSKPRDEQYFSNTQGKFFSYQRAVQEIQEGTCRDVALSMSRESWEYPLWPFLGKPKNRNLRIEHISIDNPSNKFNYPLGAFDPCLVLNDDARDIAKLSFNGASYIKTNQYAYLSIYRKDPDGSLARKIRSSNFQQMLQYAFAADRLLQNAQAQGKLDQNALMESFRLRQLSVDYAKMLDPDELNQIYSQLGTQIKSNYIQGAQALMNGLSTQDPQKINEGQSKLAEFNIWITANLPRLQASFQ